MPRTGQRPNRHPRPTAPVAVAPSLETLSPGQRADMVDGFVQAFRAVMPASAWTLDDIQALGSIVGRRPDAVTADQGRAVFAQVLSHAADLKAATDEGGSAEPEEVRDMLAKIVRDGFALIRLFDTTQRATDDRAFAQVAR